MVGVAIGTVQARRLSGCFGGHSHSLLCELQIGYIDFAQEMASNCFDISQGFILCLISYCVQIVVSMG